MVTGSGTPLICRRRGERRWARSTRRSQPHRTAYERQGLVKRARDRFVDALGQFQGDETWRPVGARTRYAAPLTIRYQRRLRRSPVRDLHRRRSVTVRMTEQGEQLGWSASTTTGRAGDGAGQGRPGPGSGAGGNHWSARARKPRNTRDLKRLRSTAGRRCPVVTLEPAVDELIIAVAGGDNVVLPAIRRTTSPRRSAPNG
jgi:hypothetical protein